MTIKNKYVTHKREPFFEIATEYIQPNSKVLDIGAGNGAFSKYLQRSDFYLFDGNKQTVEELKKEYANVVLGDLPVLPFEDNFFDVIHCSHVVEHLPPHIFYETLKEMDRCLKVQGYLVISAPLLWSGFYNDLSHIRPYNPKVYRNYLCGEQVFSRTRKVISEHYKQEKIVYRFREANEDLNYTIKKSKLLFGLPARIIRHILKNNIDYYEKTGYTIVLRKEK